MFLFTWRSVLITIKHLKLPAYIEVKIEGKLQNVSDLSKSNGISVMVTYSDLYPTLSAKY